MKRYPMWEQFIAQKQKFIGGPLQDFGDSIDRRLGAKPKRTTITDITLEPNGGDGLFAVKGKKFSCGLNCQVGGIMAGEPGWVTISGYGGHEWRFKEPAEAKAEVPA